jgi:hypothetical protein
MILSGEGAVRKATAAFIAHYHTERNHQGLANALICPDPGHAVIEGKVHRREGLGGLLNYYYRKAALSLRSLTRIPRVSCAPLRLNSS